jgi:hypothetical protein
MSFSSDIGRWSDKTLEKAEKVQKGAALSVFSEIVRKTPVDQGRARANWQVDLNDVDRGIVEANDPTGSKTIAEGSKTIGESELGDTIAISNNLPYIEPLENGSSTQAPNGMVKTTVKRFKRIVGQMNRKVR